jgi:uncharacterized membrane protein YkvI
MVSTIIMILKMVLSFLKENAGVSSVLTKIKPICYTVFSVLLALFPDFEAKSIKAKSKGKAFLAK